MRLRQITTQECNEWVHRASMHFPEVTLSAREPHLPIICIEEGGKSLELEFPDGTTLAHFQQRVAALHWEEPEEASGQ